MDNQQRPIVQHRELCSELCGSLDGSGAWGRTCVQMAECLFCSSETIITLLICYTPVQNRKVKKKKEKRGKSGKKIKTITAADKDGEKLSHRALQVGMSRGAKLQRTVWQVVRT